MSLDWDSDVHVTRWEWSGWLWKETLPTCFWRHCWKSCQSKGCKGDYKKSIAIGWAKDSIQKVCRDKGRKRTGMCGRGSSVEWDSTAERWTIRLHSSKKWGGGSRWRKRWGWKRWSRGCSKKRNLFWRLSKDLGVRFGLDWGGNRCWGKGNSSSVQSCAPMRAWGGTRTI